VIVSACGSIPKGCIEESVLANCCGFHATLCAGMAVLSLTDSSACCRFVCDVWDNYARTSCQIKLLDGKTTCLKL
jgi:hypothetical protein